MRVSSNAFSSSLVQQLHQLNQKQTRLHTQAATGQRLQWAEDDPRAMEQALDLQAASQANGQYAKNIGFLSERSRVVLTGMRAVNTVLDRANEIAIRADGTRSPDELRAFASEVDQLIRQAVEQGNVRHRGDYVFGGTASGQSPFVITENADGEVGTVDYRGNADVPELEIAPGSSVPMQIAGANTTGAGATGLFADGRSGVDIFAHLISLRDHLKAGDTAAIAATDRDALSADEDHVLFRVADSGAQQARLETAATSARNGATQLRQAFSETTDVDLATTLVELTSTQTAYRAALQSGANLLDVSLMDYLR